MSSVEITAIVDSIKRNVFLFDKDDNLVHRFVDVLPLEYSTVTLDFSSVPDGFKYMRLACLKDNIPSAKAYVSQLPVSSLPDNSFSKSLLKDITTSLFADEAFTTQKAYIDKLGTVVPSASWMTNVEFIDVSEGECIKYIGDSTTGSSAVPVFGYDDLSNPVRALVPRGDNFGGIVFFIPNGVTKIKACSYKDTELKIQKLGGNGSQSLKNKINKHIRWVGHSIWWYDGKVLSGTSEVARGYQTLLKEQFSFLGESNYCYSGYSLGGLTESDTSSIMNKSSTWTATSADIWTLDSTTNDFRRNIPIGTIDDYTNKTGITTFFGALREFKDKINELSGNDAIVICSNALRRNNAGYTSTSTNTAGHGLVDYEKALLKIALLEDWYFVDQFRLSGVNDDTLEIVTIDGLHLNNLGYKLAVLPWYSVFDHIK